MRFKTKLAKKVYDIKYSHLGSWSNLADELVKITDDYLTDAEQDRLRHYIKYMKFIPAGRYLYYAGRKTQYYNNCYLFRAEDTREGWAKLFHDVSSALMCGGGTGVDYSALRPNGSKLKRTGGVASGPISLMRAIDNIAKEVRQGASRRSANYASLDSTHEDVQEFIKLKQTDGVIPFTNISVNFNSEEALQSDVFWDTLKSACTYGSPGMSFNLENPRETLRNAPVSADTQILTQEGYVTIRDTLGKKVTVWTGKQWAETEFVKTKSNVHTVVVSISNGGRIKADPEHEFFVCDSRGKVSARDLNVNDTLLTVNPKSIGRELVTHIAVGQPEDVYCCDVKVPEHSFMAEGVIISNCCEVTSEDSNDVCNLGSVNMANIDRYEEFRDVVTLGEKFLLCGSQKAMLPHKEIEEIRAKNNRTGLGLMGMHEWLLKRSYSYSPNPELATWLEAYKDSSENSKIAYFCYENSIPTPEKYRAIAPTGSTSILAGTTSGIEPIFCPAYLRGYHREDGQYKHEYAVDPVAKSLHRRGIDVDTIECAYNICPIQRIEFQAFVQKYVDHAISSTVNLPKPLTDREIDPIRSCLQENAAVLRGITFYPDGAKGNQPFQPVSFSEALKNEGKEKQITVCELNGSGVCGD